MCGHDRRMWNSCRQIFHFSGCEGDEYTMRNGHIFCTNVKGINLYTLTIRLI